MNYDITLRHVAGYGWIALFIKDGKEVFRSWEYFSTSSSALFDAEQFINQYHTEEP